MDYKFGSSYVYISAISLTSNLVLFDIVLLVKLYSQSNSLYSFYTIDRTEV